MRRDLLDIVRFLLNLDNGNELAKKLYMEPGVRGCYRYNRERKANRYIDIGVVLLAYQLGL